MLYLILQCINQTGECYISNLLKKVIEKALKLNLFYGGAGFIDFI